jgi:hypothetical protein
VRCLSEATKRVAGFYCLYVIKTHRGAAFVIHPRRNLVALNALLVVAGWAVMIVDVAAAADGGYAAATRSAAIVLVETDLNLSSDPGICPGKGDGFVTVDDGDIAGGDSNDTCANAENIDCGATKTVDLALAHTTPDEPAYPCRFQPGQGAHNVWYRFTATATSATVRTCGSQGVDSVLAVYSGVCGALTQIGCNDDFCPSANGGNAFDSSVDVAGLVIGQSYLIQLGAYDDSAVGIYTLQVICPAASCANCPPGSVIENDASCGLTTPDPDGGCNNLDGGFAAQFGTIACGQTLCGRGRINAGAPNRDTDWYEFTLSQAGTVTWTVTAEFAAQAAIIVPGALMPCDGYTLAAESHGAPCAALSVSAELTPGTYWVFAAAQSGTTTVPCGETSDYVATLSCASSNPCGNQVLGDANCDGVVNNFDIDCFVLALTNPAQWQTQCSNNGQCTALCVVDTNRDAAINNFDIDPFVTCIVNNGCP